MPRVDHGQLSVQLPAGGFGTPEGVTDDFQRERELLGSVGDEDGGDLEGAGSPDDGRGGMKKFVSFGLHSR